MLPELFCISLGGCVLSIASLGGTETLTTTTRELTRQHPSQPQTNSTTTLDRWSWTTKISQTFSYRDEKDCSDTGSFSNKTITSDHFLDALSYRYSGSFRQIGCTTYIFHAQVTASRSIKMHGGEQQYRFWSALWFNNYRQTAQGLPRLIACFRLEFVKRSGGGFSRFFFAGEPTGQIMNSSRKHAINLGSPWAVFR